MPIKSLPIDKNGVVPIIEMAEPIIPKRFARIAPFLRPSLMKGPPRKLPIIRPTTAAELMIVLYRIVSSSSQPNLASNTVVVYALPAKANEVYQTPTP